MLNIDQLIELAHNQAKSTGIRHQVTSFRMFSWDRNAEFVYHILPVYKGQFPERICDHQ